MCVDWSKPIQTKSGKPARYLGELGTCVYRNKIVAVKESVNEFVDTFRENGTLGGQASPEDIINVPQEIWVNIYPAKSGDRPYVSGALKFPSYEAAKRHSREMCSKPVATVKVS